MKKHNTTNLSQRLPILFTGIALMELSHAGKDQKQQSIANLPAQLLIQLFFLFQLLPA